MFGQNLKKVRTMYHISQAKLGEHIGVSQRTISDWEKERTEPNLEALMQILLFFDITFEELMES